MEEFFCAFAGSETGGTVDGAADYPSHDRDDRDEIYHAALPGFG
jgi:hypothetical protein